eukprot:jgi/Mesvir1/1947/Mv22965-RA.1
MPPSVKDVPLAAEGSLKDYTLIFVYGTLKQGHHNHPLMKKHGDVGAAHFVGSGKTHDRFPLVMPGPYHTPYLLDVPSVGHNVTGELYLVNGEALAELDELEGVHTSYYKRKSVHITDVEPRTEFGARFMAYYTRDVGEMDMPAPGTLVAHAYFEGGHLTPHMIQLPHLPNYGHSEAAKYVTREHRPKGMSSRQAVHAWLQPFMTSTHCQLPRHSAFLAGKPSLQAWV